MNVEELVEKKFKEAEARVENTREQFEEQVNEKLKGCQEKACRSLENL